MTTNKNVRKATPIARGVLDYFPDAIAAIANVSYVANEQHNPGEEMHWNRGKSRDHADALVRHLLERGTTDDDGLLHSAKVAWRALALLQVEIEQARDPQASPLSLADIARKHDELWQAPVDTRDAEQIDEDDSAAADAAALGYGPTDRLDPLSEAADYDDNPLPTVEEMSQSIDDEAIQAAARQMERLGLIDNRSDEHAECACAKKRLAIEEKTLHQMIDAATEAPVEVQPEAPLPENIPNPPSEPIVIHVTFQVPFEDALIPGGRGYNTAHGYFFTLEEEVYYVESHQSMVDGGRTDPLITKSARHADIFGDDLHKPEAERLYQRLQSPPVWGYSVVPAFIQKRAEAYVAEHAL